MNLQQTVEQSLKDSGVYAENMTWEEDFGIIYEIILREDIEQIEKFFSKRDKKEFSVKPDQKVFKVSDNWRKRTGYMLVDRNLKELDFYDVFIY
jgi:hypothetical protein